MTVSQPERNAIAICLFYKIQRDPCAVTFLVLSGSLSQCWYIPIPCQTLSCHQHFGFDFMVICLLLAIMRARSSPLFTFLFLFFPSPSFLLFNVSGQTGQLKFLLQYIYADLYFFSLCLRNECNKCQSQMIFSHLATDLV